VTAAIGLADEAGAGALTMKAVAARLGPYSAMALYRYVHSKDGLVDLMLDAATAEIPRPVRPGPDWRADLEELAAAVAGPGFCPSAGQIASVLLSLSVQTVISQVAKAPKPASSPLARDLAARAAAGQRGSANS
jgi:AcrR family transcriptional regulator